MPHHFVVGPQPLLSAGKGSLPAFRFRLRPTSLSLKCNAKAVMKAFVSSLPLLQVLQLELLSSTHPRRSVLQPPDVDSLMTAAYQAERREGK